MHVGKLGFSLMPRRLVYDRINLLNALEATRCQLLASRQPDRMCLLPHFWQLPLKMGKYLVFVC